MKICVHTFLVVLLSFSFSHALSADDVFQATITGTIADGTLNGFDLFGLDFTFNATITNSVDQSSNEQAGTFYADAAWFSFDNGASFVADPNAIGIIVTNDNQGDFFQIGFLTDLVELTDALGYSDFSEPLQFDPNILQEISFVDSFDLLASNGTLNTSNTAGDFLEIAFLGNATNATAQIVAIPEPSATIFGLVLILPCLVRRSR